MLPLKGDRQYWTTPWKPGPGGCTQVWGNPNSGYPGGRHNGIDLGCLAGTAVYAAWQGRVVKADYDSGYGRHVRILHPDGSLSIYGHFARVYAVEGQELAEGDYLGDSGGGLEDPQRGASDGPHLHFEVRSNPFVALSNIDPIAWLEKMEGTIEPQEPLTGRVIVTAKPWVRIREQPGLDHKEIGKLYTGEILTVAPGVAPVVIGGAEWTPIIYWTGRGPKDDPWLTQL